MDIIKEGKTVFEREIDALKIVHNTIDENFEHFVNCIVDCQGRVVITGMGKSGHICKKIVATMQSLGIKAYFMHPAEGLHGDLGLLTDDDIVIAISKSGESDEIIGLIPTIKTIGANLLCITSRPKSTLNFFSSHCITMPDFDEAFLGSLVPTSSTTVSLVLGDAMAICAAKLNGFTENDFGVFHPSGLLGKKLTMTAADLMKQGEDNSVVKAGSLVKQAVFEMCSKAIGGVGVVDENNALLGIFTDGDMRRLLNKQGESMLNLQIDSVMTTNPYTVSQEQLIVDIISEAKKKMNFLVSVFPVVDEGKLIGMLGVSDIMKSGLMG